MCARRDSQLLAHLRVMLRDRSSPADLGDIALLDAESRRFVAATAARRSELELHGAAAFTVITQALIDLRADLRIVDLAARAIGEELDHSAVYLSLARAYALYEVPPPRPRPIDVPTYQGVSDDGQRLLQVVGMCSINETMACSFLELCLEGARAAPVRAGLRSVWKTRSSTPAPAGPTSDRPMSETPSAASSRNG